MSGSAAFVAGATGFTGREVVRILAEKNIHTFAHVRPDSPRLAEWRERFSRFGAKVDTTRWDEEAMTETFRRLKPSHVFALLGTIRARGRKAARAGRVENYETVDYGLTALLVRAVEKAGVRPRFVYLSAAGVRKGATSAYYAARWKVEELLQNASLPFTIARPSIITGPDRDDGRMTERASVALIDTALAVAGTFGGSKLRERYRSTTNTILAQALVRLAFLADAENRVIESEDLR